MAEQIGVGNSGSDHAAREALELLLGEATIRQAVDHYIAGRDGAELARSVLWLLRPWSGMQYCYEIYQSNADIETKRFAIELLRVMADRRVLPWIEDFLNDADEGIQNWGIGVIDQMAFKDLVSESEVQTLLNKSARHPNPNVRRMTQLIRECFAYPAN